MENRRRKIATAVGIDCFIILWLPVAFTLFALVTLSNSGLWIPALVLLIYTFPAAGVSFLLGLSIDRGSWRLFTLSSILVLAIPAAFVFGYLDVF